MFPASTHQGYSVSGFPDVCKTPSPAGPVPIPYPNAGYGQQNTAASKAVTFQQRNVAIKDSNFVGYTGDEAGVKVSGNQMVRTMQLRGQLHMLHAQIANLPSGNPTRWHKLLDEYVVYTAELYRVLSE